MKFLGALAILLAMAILMTGAGGGPGATYVDHDKVTAALAKGMEIDIAIDLKGVTKHSRNGYLSRR